MTYKTLSTIVIAVAALELLGFIALAVWFAREVYK